MVALGFQYEERPASTVGPTVAVTFDIPPEQALRSGYGLIERLYEDVDYYANGASVESTSGEPTFSSEAENDSRLAALSACREKAEIEHPGVFSFTDHTATLISDAYQSAIADQRYLSASDTWRSCMSSRGFPGIVEPVELFMSIREQVDLLWESVEFDGSRAIFDESKAAALLEEERSAAHAEAMCTPVLLSTLDDIFRENIASVES